MHQTGLVEELRRIVGDPRRVSDNPSVLEQHGQDRTSHPPRPPEAVVFPASTDEVSRLLAFANDRGIPVVPYGVGSSLEGHVIPVYGGISINLTQMNNIIEIRPDDMIARVQPGVTRRQLNRALQEHGLFFPVDPGADASIGGMTATNASGTNAVRYGAMRHQVLGLEVVAADGTVFRTGSTTFKSSSGYNLTGLLVGSEGTLGVFTEITLRLHPIPAFVMAGRVVFPSVENAVTAAIGLVRAGLAVAKVELVDARTIAAINNFLGTGFLEQPTLFLELSGNQAGVLENARIAREICEIEECISFELETDEAAREELWSARYQISMALRTANPGCKLLSTDICVPMSVLPAAIRTTRQVLDSYGLEAAIFGHVGDGNYHASMAFQPDDAATIDKIHRAYSEIVSWALAHGGTCTGEHGIGLGKIRFLQEEHGLGVGFMQRIKQLMDPRGILNPGKVLPGV